MQRRGGQPLITAIQSISPSTKNTSSTVFRTAKTIAGILLAIDEKTAALEKEVEHLDELFHAMLDALFS